MHLLNDASVESLSDYFDVDGTLNFVESKDYKFTCSFGDLPDGVSHCCNSRIIGDGQININSGNFEINSNSLSFYVVPKIKLCDGGFFINGTNRIDLTSLTYVSGHVSSNLVNKVSDEDGYSYRQFCFPEESLSLLPKLPVTTDQFGTKPFKATIAADGTSDVLYSKKMFDTEFYVPLYINKTAYLVDWELNINTVISDVPFVEFKDGDETIKSYYCLSGDTISLPESDYYDYTFSCNGESVTDSTVVSSDMVITVSKEVKDSPVTIDGTPAPYHMGDTLSGEFLYLDAQNKQIVYPGTVIDKPYDLTTTTLSYKKIDNQDFGQIWNWDDFDTFASLVNETGVKEINVAIVSSDIPSRTKPTPMIGTEDHPFSGIFNGNYYTLPVNINTDQYGYTALFAHVDNAKIMNLTISGSITNTCSSDSPAAAFVGDNVSAYKCTIEKCTNMATVKSATSIAAPFFAKINAKLTVKNCINSGKIISDWSENYQIFIGPNYGASQIINCVDISDTDFLSAASNGYENCFCYTEISGFSSVKRVSKEDIEGGRLTYLLNQGNDSIVWYQPVNTNPPSVPRLTGDLGTEVVYAGCMHCEDELTFSNHNDFILSKPGHQPNYDSAEYENGNLRLTCGNRDCFQWFDAHITFPSSPMYEDEIVYPEIFYHTSWEEKIPERISLKYSLSPDGEYIETPNSAGTWYIKIFFSNSEKTILLDKTLTVLPTFELNVLNGTFDSQKEKFRPGEEITITADEPITGMLFDKWELDCEEELSGFDQNSKQITITMPEADVKLSAVYRNIKIHTWSFDADKNVLKAACNEDCEEGALHTAQLTLSATGTDITIGSDAERENWTKFGLTLPKEVQYYNGDTLLEGVPSKPGDYKACVSYEGKTAFVTFTILKPAEDNISSSVVGVGNTTDTDVKLSYDNKLLLESDFFTDEEKEAIRNGAEAKVILKVGDGAASSERKLLKPFEKDYNIFEFLDITLAKQVGTAPEKQVKETNYLFSLTVDLSNIKNIGDKVDVISVHDSAAEKLSSFFDGKKITFKTGKFSLYGFGSPNADPDVPDGKIEIKFDPNGGTSDKDAIEIIPGKPGEMPKATKKNVIFGGWKDEKGNYVTDLSTLSGNAILTASWENITVVAKQKMDISSFFADAKNSYIDKKKTETELAGKKFKEKNIKYRYRVLNKEEFDKSISMNSVQNSATQGKATVNGKGILNCKKSGLVALQLQFREKDGKKSKWIDAPGSDILFIAIEKPISVKNANKTFKYIGERMSINSLLEYEMAEKVGNIPNFAECTITSSKPSSVSVNALNGEILAVANGKSKISLNYKTPIGKSKSGKVKYSTVKISFMISVKAPQFKKTEVNLKAGKSTTLKLKNVAKNTPITWSSDNESVATVTDGKVKAVGNGTATIKAIIDGRDYICKVNVK